MTPTSRGARAVRRRAKDAFAGIGLALLATPGLAQEWPSKPIKLVVPFSPGGATDVVSRVIADKLSVELRQPVTIDNRPGAGGNIGAVVVAKSPADGYTMFVAGSPGFPNAAALTKDPGFDAEKDFVPVAMIATQSVLLTLHQSVPANTLAELVTYAKSKPGQLSYGTPGIGTPHHLAMELLKQLAGIDLVHVPYRGGAPMAQDAVAGQVPVMFASYTVVAPHLGTGKLKIVGNSSKRPMTQAPHIKSIAEQGYPDFDVVVWFGLMAPTGTPRPAIDRMSEAVHTVTATDEIRQRLLPTGSDPPPKLTPADFGAQLKTDIARWSGVVRTANIKAE